MKDQLKLQYRSQNLTKLQEMFINETKGDLKTNYTFTNKSIRSPSKGEFFNDQTDRRRTETSPSQSFVKKYNKVLREFNVPSGNQYITVDLDEKLKLNFLQSQIEENRHKNEKSAKSKLNDVKVNYILGSPNRSLKAELDFGFNISPRQSNLNMNRKQGNLVQTSNNFSTSIPCQILSFNEAKGKVSSFLKESKSSSNLNKTAHVKNEIIATLLDDDKTSTNIIDRINQLRFMKSQEKDLRKKVILTSQLPDEFKNKLKKDFPDYVKGDYPPAKIKFPNRNLNQMKRSIDKIFTKGYSTLRTPAFPIEKSNRLEFPDF